MTEVLLASDLADEHRQHLERVLGAAESLLVIINDILDLSKIEAGRMALESIPLGIRATVEEASASLAVRAHEKGLELLIRVEPDVPDRLRGDPGRVRQVITNLLGNAIKFTQTGEIVLRVRRGASRDDQMVLHFAISDTGIGIPADKQKAIFEAFTQADGSTTRRYGGTGLGLSISAQLVELMHGRFWLESEPGQGSTFHFTAEFQLDPENATDETYAADPALRDQQVLIADANATSRGLLADMVTDWGMLAIAVGSSATVQARLSNRARPNGGCAAAIVNVGMLDKGSRHLVDIVQRHVPPSAIIALLPTTLSAEKAARWRRHSFAACLSRPVRYGELLAALTKTIHPANAPSPEQTDPGPAAPTGDQDTAA